MSTEVSQPAEAPPPSPPESTPEPTASPAPGSLPLHLLGEPLKGQIEWVQRRYGLSAAAASLAVLVTVLGVCGPSRRIANPIGLRSVPPALSVVLYGTPTAYVQAAVELGLDPVRQWVLRRIGPPDKGQLRRARLRLGELHQSLISKEFSMNSAGVGSQVPGGEFGGALTGSELEALQKTLRDEHARILREISEVTFLLRPHLLADDTALPRLLDPGQLSTDGAVLHTSLDGHAVPAWTGANAGAKAELARLLHLAWQGLPDAGDEDRHVSPLLSNVLVVDRTGAKSLRSDRGLSAAGVTRHLFFLEASQEDAKLDLSVGCPKETAKRWIDGLQVLLSARLTGQSVEHDLDGAATKLFADFTRELFAEMGTLEPEVTRRLERHSLLALKLALLVHAISAAQAEKDIGVETIEFGCALASAVGREDLAFTTPAKPGAPAPGDHALTALVTKLRLRGSLRWRDLLRSQRVQKAEPLEKLLSQAVAAGLICKEGDRYHAV